VGVGGKWEFIGEPFKKSQRRRFYNALRVFNGDVVRIGDGVLLSAEENKPPYIARIHSMWEEPKSAGREAGHFIKAHWYYRPKDVPPKVLSAGLPKGKTVAKEVFYTDEVEDNDVRSVYGLAAIRSEPHPSGGSYLRQNEYVCRFQYFPSESRFGPVPAPKLPRAPEAESVGSGGKDKKGGSSRSPSPSASSSLANAAGSAPEQKKAGPSRKRSPSPSTASSADATLAEETSAAATSVARKSAASNAESSASSPSAPSSVRGRHLSITSPGAEEGDKEGSDSGEGDPGKRRERTRVTRHGESPLLSPRSAGGVRIECSRVGPNFQADVPASTLASLAGATDAAAAGAPKEAPDAMLGGAQDGGGGEEEEEDEFSARTWLPMGHAYASERHAHAADIETQSAVVAAAIEAAAAAAGEGAEEKTGASAAGGDTTDNGASAPPPPLPSPSSSSSSSSSSALSSQWAASAAAAAPAVREELSEAAINSFLRRAAALHGLVPGDIVRVLNEPRQQFTSAGAAGAAAEAAADSATAKEGSDEEAVSVKNGDAQAALPAADEREEGGGGSHWLSQAPTQEERAAAAKQAEAAKKLHHGGGYSALWQWGIFLEDAPEEPITESKRATPEEQPQEQETKPPDTEVAPAANEAAEADNCGGGRVGSTVAETTASGDSKAKALEMKEPAAAVVVGSSSEGRATPAEKKPPPSVHVVFMPRQHGAFKVKPTKVALSRVVGRFDEAAALGCLYEAGLDCEAALAKWEAHLASSEDPLRSWSSEEVRVLCNGIARFSDDFRALASFLPTKTVRAILQLHYLFHPLIPKQGDSVVQLFRMSEVHRLGSGGQPTTAIARAREHQAGAADSTGKPEALGGGGEAKRRRAPAAGGNGKSVAGTDDREQKRARPPTTDSRDKETHPVGSGGGGDGEPESSTETSRQRKQQHPQQQQQRKHAAAVAVIASKQQQQQHEQQQHEQQDQIEEELSDDDDSGDELARVASSQRFLQEAKLAMPPRQYERLVGILVSFDNNEITIARLVSNVMGLLGDYPKLEEAFRPFLPPNWNVNGPSDM